MNYADIPGNKGLATSRPGHGMVANMITIAMSVNQNKRLNLEASGICFLVAL